jgi:glucosyl-3-phosphoglycerate synthase
MSAQILYAVWSRLHHRGLVVDPAPPAAVLTQFRRGSGVGLPNLKREITATDVSVAERPPLATQAPLMRRRGPLAARP